MRGFSARSCTRPYDGTYPRRWEGSLYPTRSSPFAARRLAAYNHISNGMCVRNRGLTAMAATKRQATKRPRAQRIAACLALVCYAATATGLPLPGRTSKYRGQPFPCQDHPCGCATPEQCWTNCCCFSPGEHWAWARANHIEPPAYAERPKEEGWYTTRLRDQLEGGEACRHCAGSEPAHTSAEKACCAGDKVEAPCCQKKAAAAKKARNGKWLAGFASLKCRGGITHWVATGAVAPPPSTLTWQQHSPIRAWLAAANDTPSPRSLAPLDPPPRLLHNA